jgi:putative membrane protein
MNYIFLSSTIVLTLATVAFAATLPGLPDRLPQQSQPAPRQCEKQYSGPNAGCRQLVQGSQTTAAVSSDDRRFVGEAAESGMAEVAHSRLALQRAASDDVKRFAQRMIDDHTKADQELARLATSKGVPLPQGAADRPQLQGKHREMYERLARLSGAEFDREFMRNQVKMHNEAVSLFEREAGGSKDADLKAFAARTMPTLREHQQMARDISTKVGAVAKAANKT